MFLIKMNVFRVVDYNLSARYDDDCNISADDGLRFDNCAVPEV